MDISIGTAIGISSSMSFIGIICSFSLMILTSATSITVSDFLTIFLTFTFFTVFFVGDSVSFVVEMGSIWTIGSFISSRTTGCFTSSIIDLGSDII